jgi:hypothetical protein
MRFARCPFCGGLYTPQKGFRTPSVACNSCWLDINGQAFKQRNQERTVETGFLCEKCLEPLPDSPPLTDDWRVPVGRTKRLCLTCTEKEPLTREDPTFTKSYQAEGLGPRNKMRRARDDR